MGKIKVRKKMNYTHRTKEGIRYIFIQRNWCIKSFYLNVWLKGGIKPKTIEYWFKNNRENHEL